jgi:hypothetical protein
MPPVSMSLCICVSSAFQFQKAPALISEGAGLAVDPSALGAVLSGLLPRIRRSPCDTDSAAMKRGRKGTVE